MSRDTTGTAPRKRGRLLLISLITASLVLLTLAGVGIYGLIARPHENPHTPSSPAQTEPSRPAPTSSADLEPLPRTNDPIRYAEAVAEALFTWDTASGLRPADYGQVILTDADPSGTETAGLASDIATYFPAADVWRQLIGDSTSQTITIDTASVPAAWEDAVAQDRSGTLIDGMTAVTIEATRHRAGGTSGHQMTSDHPVAFTVFLACQPAFDRCHVLRLSELDNPLR